MLTAKQTNTLYFSEKLHTDPRFTATCKALMGILDKHAIKYGFLAGTKDIWCRDYMPIQVEQGKLVRQFHMNLLIWTVDLRGSLQSDPKAIVAWLMMSNHNFQKINLDGGNVVNWSDRAILTDRVFDENPEYSSKTKLIAEIEKLLEVEIIVIPQINEDITGHADGLVRFVDRNTLLGNDRSQEYKYWIWDGINNQVLKAASNRASISLFGP